MSLLVSPIVMSVDIGLGAFSQLPRRANPRFRIRGGSMRRTWRKKHLLAFFSVALLVLGSTASTFTQQAQQSLAKRDDLLPLHIAVGPISLLRMPSWVALSEGIYKKNGLEVDQCQTRVTLDELKALGITT